jgi:hypothetical protein
MVRFTPYCSDKLWHATLKPFNYLLPNKFFPPLHIQLLIEHMLIHFQKLKIPYFHTINVVVTFVQQSCFHKESNLGTIRLFFPLLTIQTLYLICITFSCHHKLCPRKYCSSWVLKTNDFIHTISSSYYWLGLLLFGLN